MMILFKKASALAHYINQKKQKGTSIGFVPTMGALHTGHLSLLRLSKQEAGLTVCSIFINPTQFNNAEDFANYPVTIEKDIELLLSAECDVLFLPSKQEIYPDGYHPEHFDLGELEHILEGKYRPGHFQGVCQVVNRLLQVIEPHQVYLGAKDYQQCMIIKKLLQLTNRINTQAMVSPTVREEDGLAMSSRNLRLSEAQRTVAPHLYKSLEFIAKNITQNNAAQLKKEATEILISKGFNVDYLDVVNADTLMPPPNDKNGGVALVAAFLGNVRLIDNILLGK